MNKIPKIYWNFMRTRQYTSTQELSNKYDIKKVF